MKQKNKFCKRKHILPVILLILALLMTGCKSGSAENSNETDEITFGIDVAKYQGTIDWEQVSQYDVDFAMIRVGYRTVTDGEIMADTNARYNMQEAQKRGIRLGAYFFSTAISEEEAIEEANWVADFIAQYPITYPVAYDCEMFQETESRQNGLDKYERTDIALAFLKTIEKRGYDAMFYSSKNELQNDAQWMVSEIEDDYKIWVAQYPNVPYPDTPESSYEGKHHMWQYTATGNIPGINQSVDLNVAYFGYLETALPKDTTPPEEVGPDIEALMDFEPVNEQVTAKHETNLRNIPSQDSDSQVLYTLMNGETATRIAISNSGWSKLEYRGDVYYAVSSYLTTDMNYDPANRTPVEDPEGIQTQFLHRNELVTAKDIVNLRTLPSVTNEDSEITAQLKNGDVAKRIGISEESGWSMLEYNGETYYAVSSYLTTDIDGTEEEEKKNSGEIQTRFQDVNERVTPKDAVNLRTMPSTEHPDCKVVVKLKNGEVVTRTGINADVGWSRVDYNGQTLYCISSYLIPADE